MPDLSALRTTLNAPLNAVLDQHRADIVRKFSGTGDFSQSFLANEELVRQVRIQLRFSALARTHGRQKARLY